METYTISITSEQQHQFQVIQYPHHATGGCKYKIYQKGDFVASLEPDKLGFLHVCKNPANIDLEILHLLAEQIQSHHPGNHNLTSLENIEFDKDDEMEAPPQKDPVQ